MQENLYYTEDHEWIKIENKVGIIGITDFAQGELGDIVYLEIESKDEEMIAQGEVVGSIEAVKTVADIFMPLSGKIIEINEILANNPELVNTDPYGDGWIAKIIIKNKEEIDGLLSLDEYKSLIIK